MHHNNGHHHHEGPSSRTFPTYVLGLLTALEADPSTTAANLHQSSTSAPSGFAMTNGSNSAERPAETDAIYAAVTRIAERLAKAESSQRTYHQAPRARLSLSGPIPPPPEPPKSHGSQKRKQSHASSPFASGVLQDLVNGGPKGIAVDDGPRSTAEEELGQLKDQVKDFARVLV